jgi:hypothetical protein
MNDTTITVAQIIVWDHWAGEWRQPTEEERAQYVPPKEGQLMGSIGGSFFSRRGAQRLSHFTGKIKVKRGKHWELSAIDLTDGEVGGMMPSCAILAGFVAVRLGQGDVQGRDYGQEWKIQTE